MQRFLLVTFLTWGLLTSLCTTLTKTRAQNRSDEAQIRELQQKLQEPMPPENQSGARDLLAKQQADAAIALLKLGPDSQLWSLLRHSSDDSRRTYLIHWPGAFGCKSRCHRPALGNRNGCLGATSPDLEFR